MLIIEWLAVGYKVRAKIAGDGPNQPNTTARTMRELKLAVEHYFGGETTGGFHMGQRKNCPFCRQMANRLKKTKGA